jgi:hypothetical protein
LFEPTERVFCRQCAQNGRFNVGSRGPAPAQ